MITHEPGDIIDFSSGEIYGENSFYADVAIWIGQQLQDYGDNFILLDKKDLTVLGHNDMVKDKTFWVSMYNSTRHYFYECADLTSEDIIFVDNILLKKKDFELFYCSNAYKKLFNYFYLGRGDMSREFMKCKDTGEPDVWILNVLCQKRW
jgi:hypothetical protein